ncbi:MAG: metal-sensitive transcriptional regulator [Sporomusaceae bacterium]|nr:metal-sensitive transcriptional regulator [Sporomusaceae bacterium]
MVHQSVRLEVLNRLRNVKGHIAGIERMVEDEQECSNILVQLAAVRASIEKTGIFILEQNTLECLLKGVDTKPDDRERVEQVVRQMLAFLK